MSTRSITLRPRGLITDPSEISAAPPGAMSAASNVVIRRDGIVEPRPGFYTVTTYDGVSERVLAVVPLAEDSLVYTYRADGTYGAERLSDQTNMTIVNYTGVDDFAPLTPARIGPRAVQSRGNTYLTHHGRTLKIPSLSGTETFGAGVLNPVVDLIGLGGTVLAALPAAKTVSYRAVLVRKDANGYEVRSRPSEKMSINNGTGSTADVVFRILNIEDFEGFADISRAASLQDADVVEIYRTLAVDTGSTPEEEYFLAASYVVEFGSFSTLSDSFQTSTVGYKDIVDSTPEATLGAALYTNPSQDGALSANQPPPASHDMVEFRRSIFYFNVAGAQTLKLQIEGEFTTTASTFSGDILSGTDTITNVVGTAVVGSYIQTGLTTIGGNPYQNPPSIADLFPVDTFVVSQVGTTVTVSADALGTATGEDVWSWGWVSVDGVLLYYRQGTPIPTEAEGAHARIFDATEPELRDTIALDLAASINKNVPNIRATAFIEDQNRYSATIVLEKFDDIQAQFAFRSGEAMVFVPETVNSPGHLSASQQDTGGFAWSKTDLPEAVPLQNYAFIGQRDEAILGAKALRDSIIVFTERAVYRISRYGEEIPRVDVLDPTLRCIAPNTIQVLEDVVYAWTDRGVVAITEGGTVTEISDPFITDQLFAFERELSQNPLIAGSPSSAACPPTNEYVFTVAQTGNPGFQAFRAYVWNTKTRTWVEWLTESFGIAYDRTNQQIVIADNTTLRLERTGETYYNADADSTVTLSSMSGDSGTSSADLVEGDALIQAGAHYVVISPGTSFMVDRAGLVDGSATRYRSFISRVGFVANTMGQADQTKTWQAVQWIFSSLQDTRYVIPVYFSSLNSSGHAELRVLRDEVEAKPYYLRHWVPRDLSWSERLYAEIEINSAGSRWQLEGISVEAQVESSAGRRQAS